MLVRRSFLAGVLLLVSAAATPAQNPGPRPITGDASLEETLVFGLRPRTPDDNEFIDLVVARVENKTLPLELVISTYRWALRHKPYPFPFFERGLRQRARQRGIIL